MTALLTRAWLLSLFVLAALLPFESKEPLLTLGGVDFTSLELAALAALGLWVARQWLARQPPLWTTPLTVPVGLLLAALILASLLSPVHQINSLRTTARWLLGAAAGLMMVDAVKARLPGLRWLQLVALSGVSVALLAWLEIWAGTDPSAGAEAVRALLAPFRSEPVFLVGGDLRAATTLGYPTIAAMYLEVVFFLVVGWLALALAHRRTLQSMLLLGSLVVVAGAMFLTLTRSALASVLLAVALVVVARWHRSGIDAFARAALLGALSLAIIIAVSFAANPLVQLRMLSETDRSWYRAAYEVSPQNENLPLGDWRAGETAVLTVRVRNTGQRAWEAQGTNAVRLFYHWLSADRRLMVVPDGPHFDLPHNVAPGEAIDVQVEVLAPSQAGDYVLAWDMLREEVLWFSAMGAPMHEMIVRVQPGAAAAAKEGSAVPRLEVDTAMDRLSLWRAALQMLAAHPLTGVGPGNYRLARGPLLGLTYWDDRLHSNNTYLELFANAGLLGGTAFLVLVWSIVRLGWKAVRVAGPRKGDLGLETRTVLASLVGAFAAFFVHGFTDYFLDFTSIYLLFWMSLGLLVALIPQGDVNAGDGRDESCKGT